jgi:hypothetical protein
MLTGGARGGARRRNKLAAVLQMIQLNVSCTMSSVYIIVKSNV